MLQSSLGVTADNEYPTNPTSKPEEVSCMINFGMKKAPQIAHICPKGAKLILLAQSNLAIVLPCLCPNSKQSHGTVSRLAQGQGFLAFHPCWMFNWIQPTMGFGKN